MTPADEGAAAARRDDYERARGKIGTLPVCENCGFMAFNAMGFVKPGQVFEVVSEEGCMFSHTPKDMREKVNAWIERSMRERREAEGGP